MKSYLPKAIHYTTKGEMENALIEYKKAYRNKEYSEVLFQNYGALLKQNNMLKESELVLKEGLEYYPDSPAIHLNLGNLYCKTEIYALAVSYLRKSIELEPESIEARISLINALKNMGANQLAMSIASQSIKLTRSFKERARIVAPLIEMFQTNSSTGINEEFFMKLYKDCKGTILENKSEPEKIDLMIMLAQLAMVLKKSDEAVKAQKEALRSIVIEMNKPSKGKLKKDFVANWHAFNWNLAIFLLKQGSLELGWQLYEHGLCVEAKGPQRWQRSLFKPFTSEEVPIWDGQKNVSVLVLGEQGIGDTMMFLSLLPSLVDHYKIKPTLVPGDRLVQIYRRTFPDFKTYFYTELENIDRPHYQIACGSIPRFICSASIDFTSRMQLISYPELKEELRQRYLKKAGGRKIVGISWKGGIQQPKRAAQKSVEIEFMLRVMKDLDLFGVSLQYGDVKKEIVGIDPDNKYIYVDTEIDAVKNMDKWLCQVSAVDFVLTVANTTVHGAGGLHVPCLALISQYSDWRWLDDPSVEQSYIYPTCKIARITLPRPTPSEYGNILEKLNALGH